jgi:hypothetical protein
LTEVAGVARSIVVEDGASNPTNRADDLSSRKRRRG